MSEGKVSPSQLKFMKKISDPERGEYQNIARVDLDARWEMIGLMARRGFLTRTEQLGYYQITPAWEDYQKSRAVTETANTSA